MKHLIRLLFLSTIFSFSCSDQGYTELDVDELPSINPEKISVSLGLSKASLTEFQSSGISELGIYVYLNDSIVYDKNLSLNNGDLKIEVPLGENLKTFAVANAGNIVDKDSLSKVIIYQDINNQKEIFVSEVVSFISDKTVKEVNLELKRMVGQAVFQPKETMSELETITDFDALDIIFNNVVTGYKPGKKEFIVDTITVNTDIKNNYKASVYSFPSPSEKYGSVEVVYLKNKEEVNRTLRALDVAIDYAASNRVIINMPVLNSDYLVNPFSVNRMKSTSIQSDISVQEVQF